MKDDVELKEEYLEENEEYEDYEDYEEDDKVTDSRNIFEKLSDWWRVVKLIAGVAALLRFGECTIY